MAASAISCSVGRPEHGHHRRKIPRWLTGSDDKTCLGRGHGASLTEACATATGVFAATESSAAEGPGLGSHRVRFFSGDLGSLSACASGALRVIVIVLTCRSRLRSHGSVCTSSVSSLPPTSRLATPSSLTAPRLPRTMMQSTTFRPTTSTLLHKPGSVLTSQQLPPHHPTAPSVSHHAHRAY